jgi:transposase InsO family protein
MDGTVKFAVGSRIVHDGNEWMVASISGQMVVLERPGVPTVLISLAYLLTRPDFRVVGAPDTDLEALAPQFAQLSRDELKALLAKEEHVREVLTGYRSGNPITALDGEPRSPYLPGVKKMVRYEAKAAELGVSVPTVRLMVRNYGRGGLGGLMDKRLVRSKLPLGRVDKRWISTALEALDTHVDASQPGRDHLIARIDVTARARYGDKLKLPSASTARRVLKEISRGRYAFQGESAKEKRSVADRPATPYGHLYSCRLGEYLLLDTTQLDVYAMDPITLRWMKLQLTVAMDLASRSITGIRLSPVSAKAVDAAMVLYESLFPGSRSHTGSGLLPYTGVPSEVYLPDPADHAGLPGVYPDTVIIDHGRMYMSDHVRGVCQRLGFSIQPARVLQSTDKAVLERWFKTLRDDLLQRLRGYKGPDVYSRGKRVENLAFYFIDELEAIIREWIVTQYHTQAHEGLVEPGIPGLELSPDEMRDVLMARGGHLLLPARPGLVHDFLDVAPRTIQHYGVEVNGLRYDGEGLNGYRNTTSPFKGGLWPIRYDPDFANWVLFQRPDDHEWHYLNWKHADDVDRPFSFEAARYARRLARTKGRHVSDKRALIELLDQFDAGILANPTERRIAWRLSQQRDARIRDYERKNKISPDDAVEAEDAVDESSATSWYPLPPVPDEDVAPVAGASIASSADDDDDLDDGDDDFYFDALDTGV